MLRKKKIIIGSRGSKLSLAYSEHVKKHILKANQQIDSNLVEIKIIKTSGDIYKDRNISEIGGKGVFTKEIEEELLNSKIDIAVHSLKDLPSRIPRGLCVQYVMKRNDPRDAFLSYSGKSFFELRPKSIIGTSSFRRKAQLNSLRNDISINSMRGNIDTRVKKLKDKKFDGIVLSIAGLKMLNLEKEVVEIFPVEQILPAAGQGIIALQCKENDLDNLNILKSISDKETLLCMKAERALLETIGGDCDTAVGALAQISENKIHLKTELFADDGIKKFKVEELGALEEAKEIGHKVGKELIEKAGSNFTIKGK